MITTKVDLAVELLEGLLGIIQVRAHWKLINAGKFEVSF